MLEHAALAVAARHEGPIKLVTKLGFVIKRDRLFQLELELAMSERALQNEGLETYLVAKSAIPRLPLVTNLSFAPLLNPMGRVASCLWGEFRHVIRHKGQTRGVQVN